MLIVVNLISKCKLFEKNYTMLFNNFGHINLNSSNIASMMDGTVIDSQGNTINLQLLKETMLIDLISQYLPDLCGFYESNYIDQYVFDNEIVDKIKKLLAEITSCPEIENLENHEFVKKIFGNLSCRQNLEKQSKLYIGDIKNNIFGFRCVNSNGKPFGYSNMFLKNVFVKKLNCDKNICYYIKGNFKMMMMVNTSNWNDNILISEHIFIHKFPSTLLFEKIYGKTHNNMALLLHKYAIQTFNPNYVVSAPLNIMVPIFDNMCSNNILNEVDPMFSSDEGVFCIKPNKMYFVL